MAKQKIDIFFNKRKIPKIGVNFKAIDKHMTLAEFKKKFTNNKKL